MVSAGYEGVRDVFLASRHKTTASSMPPSSTHRRLGGGENRETKMPPRDRGRTKHPWSKYRLLATIPIPMAGGGEKKQGKTSCTEWLFNGGVYG